MIALSKQDRKALDRLVAKCQAAARDGGWTGKWTLQVGDLDYIIEERTRGTGRDKLTAAEGEYLGIPRAFNAHVAWEEEGAEMIAAAIRASGLSTRKWAEQVMVRDERTVRRWLAGRPIPETVIRELRRAARGINHRGGLSCP
jgi:hypothetical protein